MRYVYIVLYPTQTPLLNSSTWVPIACHKTSGINVKKMSEEGQLSLSKLFSQKAFKLWCQGNQLGIGLGLVLRLVCGSMFHTSIFGRWCHVHKVGHIINLLQLHNVVYIILGFTKINKKLWRMQGLNS